MAKENDLKGFLVPINYECWNIKILTFKTFKNINKIIFQKYNEFISQILSQALKIKRGTVTSATLVTQ